MLKLLCLGWPSCSASLWKPTASHACVTRKLVLCGAWRYVHRPFNQLFLRDIGLIFVFIGDAFLVGATRPQLRASQIWLLGHALFHFSEAAVGTLALCPSARLPAITVPAIIEAVITLWAIWRRKNRIRLRSGENVRHQAHIGGRYLVLGGRELLRSYDRTIIT